MLALLALIDLDIAQRFAGGQLCERKGQALIEKGEVFDFVLCSPGLDNAVECLQVQMTHDLRKDELNQVHDRPQQITTAKHTPSSENESSHGQMKSLIYSNKSLGYAWSVGKRWDTSDFY
jgi:hypothetical protein